MFPCLRLNNYQVGVAEHLSLLVAPCPAAHDRPGLLYYHVQAERSEYA
jgi:hypothetical protein